MSSHSSLHPREALLGEFSLHVHNGGLKPQSFLFRMSTLCYVGVRQGGVFWGIRPPGIYVRSAQYNSLRTWLTGGQSDQDLTGWPLAPALHPTIGLARPGLDHPTETANEIFNSPDVLSSGFHRRHTPENTTRGPNVVLMFVDAGPTSTQHRVKSSLGGPFDTKTTAGLSRSSLVRI